MSDQFVIGDIRTIVIPDPAAGADFIYTVPTGIRLHVHSLSFNFLADANVATRITLAVAKDSAGRLLIAAANNSGLTANENITYIYAPNASFTTMGDGFYNIQGLASLIKLTPGDTVESEIKNIQVGDQLSNIHLRVEAFLLP